MKRQQLGHGILGATVFLAGITATTPAQAFSLNSETLGSDMNGMEVTVNFLGGGSETAIWNTTGFQSGGAFGTGWSLNLSGDTFLAPWNLSTSAGFTQAIASLVINTIPGNAVFDIVPVEFLTPDSLRGYPFTVLSGQAPDIHAYSVDILGAQDDLKGTLAMTWANGFTGQMSFQADTDTVAAVPEPLTIAGVALAGAGLAGVRRRQKPKA